MNINEHIKKVGIGFGVGLVLLVLVYFVGVSPLLSARKENLEKIDEINSEAERNRMLIKRADEIVNSYKKSGKKLSEIIENKLATSGDKSPFSWTGNLIQNIASKHDVSIENISRAGITRRSAVEGRDAPPPLIEEFAVNLDLSAEYHNFGRFLAELETRLPYSRIDSVSIGSGGRRRESGSERRLGISMRYSVLRFTREAFPPAERPDDEELDVSEKLLKQGAEK